ncbi:hypothetical protein HAT86_01365 [Roseovarius gahaiensis]|uniref:Translocase n=2 Tax=Roseovarius gahaiensis TaxID=2716691 RepID=A0A967EIM5_9RHOB|nr:hypothetical protein [Roseovarius gahaiensis]
MIGPRRILTAGGTFACALGIGFIMQNMATPPEGAVPDNSTQIASLTATAPDNAWDPLQDTVAVAVQDTQHQTSPKLTDVRYTSAMIPAPPKSAPQPERLPSMSVDRAVAVPASLTDQPIAVPPQDVPAPGFSCDIEMTANVQAAAMVEVSLNAPCMAHERFTLHHNGMMISEILDDDGQSRIKVPALSSDAVFMASFVNGKAAMISAKVNTLEYYDRAVIQWQGESGLHLHAFEFGADYDDAGHIWAKTKGDLKQAVGGKGGFMVRLGVDSLAAAYMAEVYTFPTGVAQKSGNVALTVEAEVTQANCGRDITAQSLEVAGAGPLRVRDLELAVPACDATGDFLVLKNMLNDLKIAQK